MCQERPSLVPIPYYLATSDVWRCVPRMKQGGQAFITRSVNISFLGLAELPAHSRPCLDHLKKYPTVALDESFEIRSPTSLQPLNLISSCSGIIPSNLTLARESHTQLMSICNIYTYLSIYLSIYVYVYV